MSRGIVFNIQRFSVHDGPGIRTTVFLKGCNLRCQWCHNPESYDIQPFLLLRPEHCIGCGACARVCANHTFAEDRHMIDRSSCRLCGTCVENCYAEALSLVGRSMTAEEILHAVETDVPYYRESGGGVTFSGGESLLQPEFVAEASVLCRARGIHVAIDTAGNVPWDVFARVPADLYLYDVKAASDLLHRALCGVGNTRILENLRRLTGEGRRVIVRVPVIPGKNTCELPQIAELLAPLRVEKVELLPYHKLGEGKRMSLGLDEPDAIIPPARSEMEEYVRLFSVHGLHAVHSLK